LIDNVFNNQSSRKLKSCTTVNFINQNLNIKIILVQELGFADTVMSLVCANAIIGDYVVIGLSCLPVHKHER
tara:strand:- start:1441 stop:1656 length:216 start_codon:yes stop_codon:yes gene_type:complete